MVETKLKKQTCSTFRDLSIGDTSDTLRLILYTKNHEEMNLTAPEWCRTVMQTPSILYRNQTKWTTKLRDCLNSY